ncbi:hypothetical protein HUJ04_010346, partial [Dendroctonus ponderosae]
KCCIKRKSTGDAVDGKAEESTPEKKAKVDSTPAEVEANGEVTEAETMKYSSSSSNYGSLIMLALAALLVLELTTTFASAYPARYSAYYASIPLEEQLIERIKQAFIEDNDLENKNHIDQAISDLLELSKGAFDIWFQHYQEKLKLMLIENISDGDKKQSNAKRSQIAELRGSQVNRFTLDGTLKRTADFGSQRDHTGQREYALRYWTHLG